MFSIETVLNVWFTIELFLRFVTCDARLEFIKNWLNIVDVVAILPYYLMLPASGAALGGTTNFGSTLKIFRLTRIVRVAKLSSYSRSLRILATTVYHSTPMLVQLAIIQISLALCFAVITFFFEQEHSKGQFQTMVDSIWYALITMYTIGFGDQVPETFLGRCAGTFCAILGLLDMAFSLPIIVFEFNYLYNLDRDECKLRPEELMGDRTEEKILRINRFHRSLTISLRKNKTSLNMLSTSITDDCSKTENMAVLWNYAKKKQNQFVKSKRKTSPPSK